MIGKRFRVLLVLGLVGTLLTACASIPTSGSVHRGGPVTQINDPLDLDFNPAPPVKGASPERIVEGFINAASSPKNNYQIAREYLTRSLASTWNPDQSVTIDDGRNRDFTHTGNQWNVQVNPVASVDAQGSYQPATNSAPVALSYGLTQQGGEWRIMTAPDGILIDSPTFRAVFSQQTLYFFSLDDAYLVPDVRWFPARVASEATRVVAAVLSGPAAWLSGAVATAFPQGTQLAVPAVTISGRVAQVDLSSEAGRASPLQLQRMQAELQESLGNLAQSVSLSVAGSVQNISPLNAEAQPQQDPSIDADPIVLRSGSFGLLNGSNIEEFAGLSPRVVAANPTAVTITAAHDQAAVFSNGTAVLVGKDSTPTVVDSRPGLIAPALDNDGFVWSVPGDDPEELHVASEHVPGHTLPTSWPSGSSIIALAVSRDGTRLAALLETPSGSLLALSGIARDSTGAPIALARPLLMPITSGTPLSLAWADESTIAVLCSQQGSATSIVLQTVGGLATVLSGPIDGHVVVGAGGNTQYMVLTASGALQAPAGIGWQTQSSGVGAVAVQLGQP